MVTLSIIIPVYNKGLLFLNPLKSICAQSHKGEFECILVDDGSTDENAAMCDEYAAMHPDIFKVIHQSNQGSSAARNTGLDAAEGTWVTFMDCDDELLPDYMDAIFPIIEKYSPQTGVQAIQYGSEHYNLKGRFRYGVKIDKEEYIPFEKEYDGQAYIWDKLYRRSFLEENGIRFYPGYDICEDVVFNIWLLALAGGMQRVPLCGYKKYNYPQSGYSTRTVDQMYKALLAYDILEAEMKKLHVTNPRVFISIDDHRNSAKRSIKHLRNPFRRLKYLFVRLFRKDPLKNQSS